jgi:ribonuclease P protein subunit RPR2
VKIIIVQTPGGISTTRRNRREIAIERVSILFELAKKTIKKTPKRAQRYVKLARQISMHYQVRIPIKYRKMICKDCKTFILPGVNCRVRTRSLREPHLVITCLYCGYHTRILLRKRRKKELATKKQKRKIKKEMSEEKPSIWIGKNGISPEVVHKISNHLDKDQLVKIKILKTAFKERNIKEFAREIAIKTESILIDIRGHSFSLYRIKKKATPRVLSTT